MMQTDWQGKGAVVGVVGAGVMGRGIAEFSQRVAIPLFWLTKIGSPLVRHRKRSATAREWRGWCAERHRASAPR